MRFLSVVLLMAGLCASGPLAYAQKNTQPARQTYNAQAPGTYVMREVDAATRTALAPADYQRLVNQAKLSPDQVYYIPDWTSGSLLPRTPADAPPAPVPALRYNLALQVVQLRGESDGYSENIRLVPASNVRGFTLGPPERADSRRFEVHTYEDNQGRRGETFLESLNPTGLRLYLLHEILADNGAHIEVYNFQSRETRFQRAARLFASRPTKRAELQEVELSRRSVLRLFEGRAAEMEAYAKANHLSFEQLDDVVKLVAQYNASSK